MNKQVPFLKTRGAALLCGVVMVVTFFGIVVKSCYILAA